MHLTGSIVPVAPGLFRNDWLPRRRAEYLSPLQGVSGSKADAIRDTTFGRKTEEDEKDDEQEHDVRSETEGQKPVEITTIPVRASHPRNDISWDSLMTLQSRNKRPGCSYPLFQQFSHFIVAPWSNLKVLPQPPSLLPPLPLK